MKRMGGAKLNTRLLSVFFVAIFLICLVSSLVFFQLLDTLETEARAVNTEQFSSAVSRLDMELNKIISVYSTLVRQPLFENFDDPSPSTSTLLQMKSEAMRVLTGISNTRDWALFLARSGKVLNDGGMFSLEEYAQAMPWGPDYTAAFWGDALEQRFSKILFPATDAFTANNGNGVLHYPQTLPIGLKSYWKNNLMVVFFLDIEALLAAAGCDWDTGFYLFDQQGRLLYSAEEEPWLRTLPKDRILSGNGEDYEVLTAAIEDKGLQLVRLVPESEATGLVKTSLSFFLTAMLLSLAVTSVFAFLSVRAAIHPVNDMLALLAEHSGGQNSGDIQAARNVLHQVLKNLEDQARSLAQKDKVLSEYLLRSHLSNVHVNVGTREEISPGLTYILFIQIHYRKLSENAFPVRRSELESLLQEMLSGILQRLFESSLTFQLEPGRFAARVTLGQGDMDSSMGALMGRLDQEKEFAWFTVVQSEPLENSEELSDAYVRILEAARQARVREESQLLRLPLTVQGPAVEFTKGDEQQLQQAVMAGCAQDAAALAMKILDRNARLNIRVCQLETLCVAVVNAAASGAEERYGGKAMIDSAGAVLNTLVTKCDTLEEYRKVVSDFILRIAALEQTQERRDPFLSRVEEYLEENYNKEFSVEEMADALNISRSYLSTCYKSKTGMNLSDTIQHFRVKKAMALLRDRTMRVSEIYVSVGFVSESTFQRQFKKYTGMTPKEYRMKQQ